MLRNRDSFFQDLNPNAFNPNVNQTNINPNMNMPYQYPVQNAQNFYSNVPEGNKMPYNNEDFDNRLAKIERQINRLDARITKLENASKIVNDDISSSMYMV